jgi:hypothetical protein
MKVVPRRFFLLALVLVLTPAVGGERIGEISRDDFGRLHALAKPQPGESPWREIPWLTSLEAARAKAAREDKPLLIFTAADGNPLGRT